MDKSFAHRKAPAALSRINWAGMLLAVLLLGGVGLQSAAAVQKSFWEDETWTATVVQEDFAGVIRNVAEDDHPPLYFLIAAVWGRMFGFTEPGLRSLSILFSALALLMAFFFTRELFGLRPALITLALLSLSPFFVMYAHNARYYSMAAVLCLAVIWSFYQYRETGRGGFLALYVLGSAAFLYTVYTAATVILACNLWWLAGWISAQRRENRWPAQEFLAWAAAQLAILILYLPWLSTLRSMPQSYLDPAAFSPGLIAEMAKRAAYLGFTFSLGDAFSPLNPLVWAGLAVVSLGLLRYLRVKPARWFLPLALIAIIEALNVLISSISTYPTSAWQALPNRTLYAFPLFILLVACGLSTLNTRSSSLLALGVLLAVYSVGIFNYFTGRELIKPHLAVPWNTMMRMIENQARQDAVLVCSQADYACSYYAKRYGFLPQSPAGWQEIVRLSPPEVWWIHINVGNPQVGEEPGAEALDELRQLYEETRVYNYAPQDPSIRLLKANFLHQDDYEHRLNVFQFSNPAR